MELKYQKNLMEKFNAKDYWENRYQTNRTSGDGSYGEQLNKKLEWLKELDIQSIYELGCGDFNFGWRLLQFYPKVTYTGVDISETIIEKNKKISNHTFKVGSEVEPADLILCVDVLLHILDDKELEETLQNLEKNWTKYLAITAYERDQDGTSGHVKIRNFDYKRFGEPIIREVVEEDGQMYFYLFKK